MKAKLKKLNRGLLLGLVLFIAVAVFVIIDLNNFKTEKPEIKQVIEEFTSGLAQFSVTPEKYYDMGKTYTGEDLESFRKKYNEYIDKYWINSNDTAFSMYWVNTKEDMKENLDWLINGTEEGYTEECYMEITGSKVTKDGPNSAMAEVTINVTYKNYGTCPILTPSYCDDMSEWYFTDVEKPFSKTCSVSMGGSFYLERTSDGWKITGYEDHGYDVKNIETDEDIYGEDASGENDPEAGDVTDITGEDKTDETDESENTEGTDASANDQSEASDNSGESDESGDTEVSNDSEGGDEE